MSNIYNLGSPMKLYEQYRERQELNNKDVVDGDIHLLTASEAEAFKVPDWVQPAVVIPYYTPEGEQRDERRYRMLVPRDKMKYWQPKGSGDPGAYLPQGVHDWPDVFADPAVPMVIVEGEVKAIIAQRYLATVPVLAIGGVTMWRFLLAQDIVWKGRVVYISFDHDDGCEPGAYKPQVANQLAKLAEALAERKAMVYCTRLGVLGAEQGMVGKIGLDDYFRQGGDAGRLITEPALPPPGCELMAEMFERYVVVNLSKPTVWDSDLGITHTFGDFREINSNKIKMEPVEGKAPRKTYVAQAFLERPDRPVADRFVLDPRLTPGFHPDGRVINLWPPFREHSADLIVEEYVTAFDTLVRTMAGEFPDQVSCWIAHYIMRPWEKTGQAVLVATPHMGIGKSLLGEMIGHCVGLDHYAEVNESILDSRFNDHLKTKTFMLWNELELRFAKSEGWMKNLLTTEMVQVEVKNGAVFSVENFRRFLFNSNMEVAARLSVGNRRVWVCFPTVTDDTHSGWVDWLRTEVVRPWQADRARWLASVRCWAERVSLEEYDPTAPVENGEAALELIEGSRSATGTAADTLMAGWVESGEPLLVISPSFIAKYKEVFNHFNGLMRKRGWKSGRKQIKVGGINLNYRVFGKRAVAGSFRLAGETATYYGGESGPELLAIGEKQLPLLISAVEHLDTRSK
jgi:hypothetical protein